MCALLKCRLLPFQTKQPTLNYFLERLSEVCSRALRKLSVITSQTLPMLSSILSRVQFFSQWSVSKHRSDFVHSIPRFWAPQEACRGTNWLIPVERLPELLQNVSHWTTDNPGSCVAPLFIQNLKMERKMKKKPFLAPFNDEPSCTVWYDWFL